MSRRSTFLKLVFSAAALLLVALMAVAQPVPPDTCLPQGCKTFTQGGYGGTCPGAHPVANPACILIDHFGIGSCFLTGVTIGAGYTATFTTAAAIAAFLPAGGTPAVFTHSYANNPATTEAGVFAGQVLALSLNVGFSNCGVTGFCANFADLRIYKGPFENYTVGQLLIVANQVLGGGALPVGITLTQLNAALDSVNQNFDNGTNNNGYLVDPNCTTEHQLAVELLGGLQALGGDGAVSLAWATASETNNDHFDLYRDGALITSLPGAGTVASRSDYRYADTGLENGRAYSYSLVAVESNGARRELATASATPREAHAAVTTFALRQNYPNPFNPTTAIVYELTDATQVTLTVFDLTGRAVAELVNAPQTAGRYSVTFDGSNLASGVYLYRLNAGKFTATRKLMLMK